MFLHELPELVQVPISSVFLSLQLEIGMNGQQIFTLIVDLPSCTYCETIGVVRVAEINIFIKTSVNLSWSLQLNMEHYFQRKENISDFARNQKSRIFVL